MYLGTCPPAGSPAALPLPSPLRVPLTLSARTHRRWTPSSWQPVACQSRGTERDGQEGFVNRQQDHRSPLEPGPCWMDG